MRDLTFAEETRVAAGSRSPPVAGDAVLVVEGRFDLTAAARVATAARVRAGSGRVTIDLSHARVEDVALAALARELPGQPIAIAGLSRHHVRLLQYLEAGAELEERA